MSIIHSKLTQPTNTPTLIQPKSNKQSKGRFVFGGKSDDFGNRLGWWERILFTTSPTDVPLEVGMKYNMRPDLLAYDLYGKASLGWFILQYNYVLDITEFVPGLQLILPTKNRLFREMLVRIN